MQKSRTWFAKISYNSKYKPLKKKDKKYYQIKSLSSLKDKFNTFKKQTSDREEYSKYIFGIKFVFRAFKEISYLR